MFNFSAAHGATTGESVGVSIPATLPDNIKAYYQTMSTQDLSNQLALDEEAKDVMFVPRWENCANIHMRFKGKPEGAVLARLSVSVSVKVASVGVQFVNVFVYGCVVLRIQLIFETPQFCPLTCVHNGGWALLLPAIIWQDFDSPSSVPAHAQRRCAGCTRQLHCSAIWCQHPN